MSDSNTIERARAISAMAQSVTDALQAASTIANRGSDLFNGSAESLIFHEATIAIVEFRKHPAIQAMLLAAHQKDIGR